MCHSYGSWWHTKNNILLTQKLILVLICKSWWIFAALKHKIIITLSIKKALIVFYELGKHNTGTNWCIFNQTERNNKSVYLNHTCKIHQRGLMQPTGPGSTSGQMTGANLPSICQNRGATGGRSRGASGFQVNTNLSSGHIRNHPAPPTHQFHPFTDSNKKKNKKKSTVSRSHRRPFQFQPITDRERGKSHPTIHLGKKIPSPFARL